MSDYTIIRRGEPPDYTGDAPGAFLGYGRALGLEQLAFNIRVVEPDMTHGPPGSDPAWGHRHRTQEEIYFVISGRITIKLGDSVEELGPLDAVRIAPATIRAVRNDSAEQAVFAMVSVKVEDIRSEALPQEDFWVGG